MNELRNDVCSVYPEISALPDDDDDDDDSDDEHDDVLMVLPVLTA